MPVIIATYGFSLALGNAMKFQRLPNSGQADKICDVLLNAFMSRLRNFTLIVFIQEHHIEKCIGSGLH